MSVTLVSAREYGWGQGLADHRFGSPFSSPPWIEAISRTYGFEIMAAAGKGFARVGWKGPG